MAFVRPTITMLLFQLSLLFCIQTISVCGNIATPPVEAPQPHHHKHAHAPVHPPITLPVFPPVSQPVHSPTHSHAKHPVLPPLVHPVKPVHPPVAYPVKPPVHSPARAPVHAHVKPVKPVQSPVAHPVHSPAKAPVHAPAVHPVKPPVHSHVGYPVKAPVHAPAVHPVKPPVHSHVGYPVKAPVHAPVAHPVHPPVASPVKPPVHSPVQQPQRKLVAIRGVVQCKACKYKGVDTLTDSAPLPGAVVELKCKNTKYPWVEKRTTDKNGYFIFMPKMVTTYGVHKCNVTLVSSPLKNCSHPTNFHGGVVGASPFSSGTAPVTYVQPPLVVYTLQPFAFEAPKKFPCQH